MSSHSLEWPLDQIARVFEEGQSFVLTTHAAADGDGIGAELALQEVLRRMGKSVLVVNSEAVPEHFHVLPGTDRIMTYEPELHRDGIKMSDVVVLLDAALPVRAGRLAEAIEAARGTRVAIDHHQASGWAELELIDKESPSATALLYHLFVKLGVEVTPRVATALLLGLVSDTGGFRNEAANSEAHEVAAQLLSAGASRAQVDSVTVKHWPLGRIRIKGRFLQSLSCAAGGQIVWGALKTTDFSDTNQCPDATEGFADEVLDISGADVSVLFLEEAPGTIRIRFRSKNTPVNKIAERLGGGGHRLAAGARIEGSLDEAVERTLAIVSSQLASH